jgi:hypothetical protein
VFDRAVAGGGDVNSGEGFEQRVEPLPIRVVRGTDGDVRHAEGRSRHLADHGVGVVDDQRRAELG